LGDVRLKAIFSHAHSASRYALTSDYPSNRRRTAIPTRTRDADPCKPVGTPGRSAGSISFEESSAKVDALVARERATGALVAFAMGARARLISLGRELDDTSPVPSERTSRLSRRRLERHISARRQVEQLLATAARLHAACATAGDNEEAGARALEGLTLHGRFLLKRHRAPKASLLGADRRPG
jgi:hypothetical protein